MKIKTNPQPRGRMARRCAAALLLAAAVAPLAWGAAAAAGDAQTPPPPKRVAVQAPPRHAAAKSIDASANGFGAAFMFKDLTLDDLQGDYISLGEKYDMAFDGIELDMSTGSPAVKILDEGYIGIFRAEDADPIVAVKCHFDPERTSFTDSYIGSYNFDGEYWSDVTPDSFTIYRDKGVALWRQTGGTQYDNLCFYPYGGEITLTGIEIYTADCVPADFSDITHGIGEGFDPSSPGNPDAPEEKEPEYTLQILINPVGAGYANISSYTLREGADLSLSFYNNTGFDFVNWTIDGTEVSADRKFTYVMPDHDVTIVANAVFNPSSPGNPSLIENPVRHPVSVRTNPANTGNTYPSGEYSLEEGQSHRIQAYPPTGWEVTGWTVNGVDSLTTANAIDITMGTEALDIVVSYKFNPASPSNPNSNDFNPETGELIIDDFRPGYLYSAMERAVYDKTQSYDMSNVTSLIVKGQMYSDDIYATYNIPNASVIDLSRTSGLDQLGSWIFESSQAAEIILPQTVSSIGYYAFYRCENLNSLTLYAMEPPAVTEWTFYYFENRQNCILNVPATALQLYADADYWKDFQLMPITANVYTLTVNLPGEAADGTYRNNNLELVNAKTGVRQKYVVSDRGFYTFSNLQPQDVYNVYLTTPNGFELGRIEDITMPGEDIEVEFDKLDKLVPVSVQVLLADGTDVTPRTTVEWSLPQADGTSKYLLKGADAGLQPEGEQLTAKVTLPADLATAYSLPDALDITADAANPATAVTLVPFRTVTLSGTVVDTDGLPMANASVSALQTLNGSYQRTFPAKADLKGVWSVDVLDAPTQLTFSAPECVNRTETIESFEADKSAFDLGRTALRSIVGARVNCSFTYRAAGAAKADGYYNDLTNVAVKVRNLDQDREITELSQQFPVLAVLDENINPGDKLELTVSSKTGAFRPVTCTVAVDDNQRAEAAFDLVGKGGITASFKSSPNAAVTAMLYSAAGELIAEEDYSEAHAAFPNLDEGEYTLVTIGRSDLMGRVLRLESFGETGLTGGKDYIADKVKVSHGELTAVDNDEVPAFDESLFRHTAATSSFTTNKSSITTGNFLTLKSSVEFKDAYRGQVGDVALVVDLPEGCRLVDQSVIQGTTLLPYTLDGQRLTVPLGSDYRTQVRFCVVPTTGGPFTATGSARYTLDGTTLTQPFGSATSTVKDLEISVPNLTASPEFTVTGAAPARSAVEVFADNVLIGQGTANAKGDWNVSCALNDNTAQGTHNIWARITSPADLTLSSETKEITYDPNAIIPTKVTMTFWNGWYRRQYNVEWNLMDGTTNTNKYDFYTATDMTFMVEFTDNDPDRLNNIVLNVFTNNGKLQKLVPVWSPTKKCWIATARFTSASLPSNVSVDYEISEPPVLDADFLAQNYDLGKAMAAQFGELAAQLNAIYESIADNDNELLADAALDALLEELGIEPADDGLERTEESIQQRLDAMDDGVDILGNILKASTFDPNVSEYLKGITISRADGLTPEALAEQGYRSIQKSDGNLCWYSADGQTWAFVDFEGNIFISLDSSTIAGPNRAPGQSSDTAEGWLPILEELNNNLNTVVNNVYSCLNECSDRLGKLIEETAIDIAGLEADRAWLYKNNGSSFMKTEIRLKLVAKAKILDGLKGTQKWLTNNVSAWMSSGNKVLGKTFSFTALILDGIEAYNELKDLIEFRDSLKAPCKRAEDANQKLVDSANRWAIGAGIYFAGKLACDIAEIGGVTAGLAALIPSGGTSATAIIAAVAVMAGNIAADAAYKHTIKGFYDRTRKSHSLLAKLCKEPGNDPIKLPDNPPTDNSDTDPNHYPSPNPTICVPINPILDPSGYVYEAVPSNRVEGVQASIYYKETKEDIYGDLYEETILWNAEEYAQKNPLFTDEFGMYQWDVPQGLWQVKFEKSGYETAFSEWLPVPPPQLDVNVAITQNKQPEVASARAYDDGVTIRFDKFMQPETLTADNIFVTAGDAKVKGSVTLEDLTAACEFADPDDATALRYASAVRFVPEEPFPTTSGELTLTVSRNVRSYAGIQMASTYQQALDIEKEVTDIVADDLKVLYGGTRNLTVYAVPAEAAANRTVTVTPASELIATVESTEVILDDQGRGTVVVRGELPGVTSLTFTIDGVEAKGECEITVVTDLFEAAAPTASRASGTEVYRGTAVTLATETANAVIYYTTDGSCPCDENGTRRVYDAPIAINGDMEIRAMTMPEGDGEPSGTVSFTYTVKKAAMQPSLEAGWTWISHNLDQGVDVTSFEAQNVDRIAGNGTEATRKDAEAFAGTLRTLEPGAAYKVHATAPASVNRIEGYATDPSNSFTLAAGANWLGYTPERVQTLDALFAGANAENLDMIVGQEGFSQFDGSKWVGTLPSLAPGLGYIYYSQSAKSMAYNVAAHDAAPQRAPAKAAASTADRRKYADIMPVILTLVDSEGEPFTESTVTLAAYCGEECRGTVTAVNGLFFMPVYGNPGDKIELKVANGNDDDEVQYTTDAALTFEAKPAGSLAAPCKVTMDKVSGARMTVADGDPALRVDGDRLKVVGCDPAEVRLLEVFDTNGLKMIGCETVTGEGIHVGALARGVYAYTLTADGKTVKGKIFLR